MNDLTFDLTDSSKATYDHNLYDVAAEFSSKGYLHNSVLIRKLVSWAHMLQDQKLAASCDLPFTITSVNIATGVVSLDEVYTGGAVMFGLLISLEKHRASLTTTAPYKSFDALLEKYFRERFDYIMKSLK